MKVICLNDYLNLNNYKRTIMYISVNNNYQHQGISKQLINKCFEYLKRNNIDDVIDISPYNNNRI